jgi:hypothetical protein
MARFFFLLTGFLGVSPSSPKSFLRGSLVIHSPLSGKLPVGLIRDGEFKKILILRSHLQV